MSEDGQIFARRLNAGDLEHRPTPDGECCWFGEYPYCCCGAADDAIDAEETK